MLVAAAQIEVTENKEVNLQNILSYIEKAQEADVICFPELSLQCEEENILPIKKDLRQLQQAAITYNCNIILGAYIKDNGKINNRIFVIDKKGSIIHQYNKRNPYKSELEYITRGRINKPFVLDGIKCAVINCWDYAFPEDGRNLAKQGAKIIFCPAYLLSHPRTKEILEKIPQVRAFDYMSYFVMVDAVHDTTFQQSKICHPLRELSSIKNQEGIIYAELAVEEIDHLREEFKNLQRTTTVLVNK